jgi:hypothetical protein
VSHITDLLDHADRDLTMPLQAMRYNPQPPTPRPWTCLNCGIPCHPVGWRGCCSARCAAWEHDQHDNYDTED